jgi:hypothetical protein
VAALSAGAGTHAFSCTTRPAAQDPVDPG